MSNTGQKRKLDDTSNANGFKYSRPNDDASQSHTQGRLDATFGQRSVFPGLDDYILTGDDSLDHEDELGGLSYLRSVREEATSIPTLLVAPKSQSHDRSIYQDGVGDTRGWYSEGAYTAVPLSPTSTSNEENESLSRHPQVVFYESLLLRYQSLREKLNQTLSPEIQAKLDLSRHPTHSKKSREGGEEWNIRLKNETPNPIQLALMSKWSVLRLLGLMSTQDAVLRRGTEVNRNTSLWLWGLLARVPERGEMNNEQIATVRDLGKKAVLVSLGFKDAAGWNDGLDAIDADMHGENLDENEIIGESTEIDMVLEDRGPLSEEEIPDTKSSEETIKDASPNPIIGPQQPPSSDVSKDASSDVLSPTEEDILAAAKTRLLGNVTAALVEEDDPSEEEDTSFPTKNTRVTLDMVLTIVGEVYGQRDLLEFREKWDESES